MGGKRGDDAPTDTPVARASCRKARRRGCRRAARTDRCERRPAAHVSPWT
jgi:hypothetical protein